MQSRPSTSYCRFVSFLAILLAALFLVGSASAQLTNATLVGVVQDQTGSVLPGAKVTARNVATNETRSDTSNTDGMFRIANLPAAEYAVKVEKSGFSTIVRQNLVLHVGEISRADFTLQLGKVEQQVEVSAQALLINTEDSRITHVVETQQLEELPLVQRNIYQLPVLEPGTSPTRVEVPSYYNNPLYDMGFTTYGKRIRSTNFMLDGAPNNDNGLGGIPAITPILDAVQEFQVSTSSPAREFGRNNGANINIITKSGSNSLHGSVWEFNRNARVNAKNFFDTEPSALVRNHFGATLGGPIRKDKTFWFASYEGLREKRGVTEKVQVETPELRAWVAANQPDSVANYLLQRFPGPSIVPGTTVLGTLGTDTIPVLGVGVGQAINNTWGDSYMVRLDNVFKNDRLFVRWAGYYPRVSGAGELTTLGGLGRIQRGFRRPADGFVGNLAVGHTHIFSNTFLNDFHFGFLRNSAGTQAFPNNVPAMILDDFTVGFGSDAFLPLHFTNTVLNFKDSMFLTQGRHGVKFGVEYNHDWETSQLNLGTRGLYEFASIVDFATDSPYLQLQHIDPTTGQSILTSSNAQRHFRRRDFSAFVQDDFKLRSNLTVNFGVRWEYFGVLKETNGKQAGIILGPGATLTDQFVNASFGALKEFYKPDRNNFAPAIGLAWDPFNNGKFSVRAGYSINYDRIHSDLLTEPARFSPPFSALAMVIPGVFGETIPYSVADVIKPTATPSPDFAAPLLPNGALSPSVIGLGYFVDQNLRTPYVEEWHLNLQYEFARDWMLEVGYAGNEGHKLAFTQDPNRVTGWLLQDPLPSLRPNPNLLFASYLTTDTNSNYHGGSVQVKKRFTHGYMLQASYNYGKSLTTQDDAFAGDFIGAGTGYWGTQDAANRRADYGRSSFDIRHRLTSNFIWDIGAFKGRSPLFRALFGGWQTNTIFSYESGRPFTVYNTNFAGSGDYNLDFGGGTQGTGYDRPNIPAFGNNIGCKSPSAYVKGLFDPSDFPTPEPGQDGNLGRNTFCGPSFKAVDFSLVKNLNTRFLGEAGKIQLRFEAFNLFNRVNLWLPNSDLAGDPLTFGKSTQAYSPRELQFGVKMSW